MHNELCQNIFIVEVVSLILLDKLTVKHKRQLLHLVLIALIIAEIEIVSTDSANSF